MILRRATPEGTSSIVELWKGEADAYQRMNLQYVPPLAENWR